MSGAVGAAWAVALLWVPPAAAKGDAARWAKRSQRLELQASADRVVLTPCQRAHCSGLSLSGSVRLSVGRLTMRAQQMRVALDEQRRPRRVEVGGGVKLSLGGLQGRASELSYDAEADVLELRGAVNLRQPSGLVLRGTRVRIAVQTGGLTVESARLAWTPSGGSAR